jgi:hypothetical protein
MAAVVGLSVLKRLLQLGATRTLPLQCAGASVRCVTSFSSLVHRRAFPALAAGLRTSVLHFPNSAGRQLSSEAVEVTSEDVEVTKTAKRSRGVQKDIQDISTLVITSSFYFISCLQPFQGGRANADRLWCVLGVMCSRQQIPWRGWRVRRRGGERTGLHSCTSRRLTLRSKNSNL